MQSKKKKGRPTEENSIGYVLDRLQIHDDETRRFIRDLAGKKYGIFSKSIYLKKQRTANYEFNKSFNEQTEYKGFDLENIKKVETMVLNAILLKDISFSNKEIIKFIKGKLPKEFHKKWNLKIGEYPIKIKKYSEIYEKVNHNLQEKDCIGFNPQEESLENLIFINSSKINNITLKSNLDNKTIIQNFHSLTMIEKLENKMKESGEDTDSLSKLAFNYLRLKEFDIVRQLTKRVFEINAEHPYASYIMALLYLNESRSKINEANNYKIMSENVKSISTEEGLKADEQDSLTDAEYLRKNALNYILYAYNGWAIESGSYIDYQTREQVILVLVDLVYVEVIRKLTLKNIETNEFTFKQIKIIRKFIEKEILTDSFFYLKVDILEFKLKVLTLIFYFKRSHYVSFGKMYFDDFSKYYFKIIFPFLNYNRFIKNQSTEINLYSIQDVFFFHFNLLFNLNERLEYWNILNGNILLASEFEYLNGLFSIYRQEAINFYKTNGIKKTMLSVRKQINKKTFTLILKFLLKIKKKNPDFNDKEYFLNQLLNFNYSLFFKGNSFIRDLKHGIFYLSESVLISHPQSISILKVFRKEYENIKIKYLQKAFDILMQSMIEIKKRKIKNSLPNNLNKLLFPEEFLSQNIYQRTLYCLSVICKDMMSIARNEKNIRIALKTLNEIYKIQPNLFTYFKKLDISSYMNEELVNEDGSETFFKDDFGNECVNIFENHDYSHPTKWRKTKFYRSLKIFQIKCKKINILIPIEYLDGGKDTVRKVK